LIRLIQNNAELLCKAAEFLVGTGKTDEAQHCYQRVLSLQPDYLDACNGLGSILAETGQYEQALQCFQKLALSQPHNATHHASLGRVLERLRRNEGAREAALLALKLDSDNVLAQLTLARLEKNESRFEEALQRLDAIIGHADEPEFLAPALLLQGAILDRQGDYHDAFEAFSRGKDVTREICKRMAVDADRYIEYIDTNRAWFSAERVEGWAVDMPEDAGEAPVFFVAFPRSGTTLVEQVLASTGMVATTSEKQIVNQIIDETPALAAMPDRAYPDYLSDLNTDDIFAIRQRYREIVRGHLGKQLDGKILVDKLPLNMVNIGFINRIFPDSKILFAVRDPRDVCLSCFMQAFALNPAMANFVSLEGTALLYAKVLELWCHYNSILELDVHVWRYEDLVSNFEIETKKIMEFIGVQWTDRIMEFHRHASKSAVNTPSYMDVATPIYTRSTQRWRNYEAELQTVIPVLEPYLRRFGYSPEL
jgi:tetratricopeptide (TPR) repeat protein